jgi:hypothetical protein
MSIEECLMFIWMLVPTYMFWNGAHEFSHVGMIQSTTGAESWDVILIPHTHNGNFYFGRTYHRKKRRPTKNELAAISLAGWGPGLLATNMLPLATFIDPGVKRVAWYTFWGAGVLSVLFAATRTGPDTDGNIAGEALGISSWTFRPIVIASAISSMALTYWGSKVLN